MVEFHEDWYRNLIGHSNEKDLLVNKIKTLLRGKVYDSCLEIGLGVHAFFADNLHPLFNRYVIIEKRPVETVLPNGVKLISGDWEEAIIKERFDIILASHVVYYFRDMKAAVNKMFDSLNEGGMIYFIVNGKEADYGPIKSAFAEMTGIPCTFTYDTLHHLLGGKKVREYTTQASLSFVSYEDLYETLRLSFDLYPKEYESHKSEVLEWLKKNIKGDRLFIDQKIIEVTK